MDPSMKLYWELYAEEFSLENILRKISNPIREYEEELVDGGIIDIGCGQSELLLDLMHLDKDIFAVDSEMFQLELMKSNLKKSNIKNLDKWSFLCQNFPKDKLPEIDYSLIILSNILHFFKLDECIKIGNIMSNMSKTGTFIYVLVHSQSHYSKKLQEADNDNYFKHYFCFEDMEKIFPKKTFEWVYYSNIEKNNSQSKIKFIEKWIDKYFELIGNNNKKHINQVKKDYLKYKRESQLELIIRKK